MRYKFKVGDRVNNDDYGDGVIKFIDEMDDDFTYAVEFDISDSRDLHECDGHCENDKGSWCRDSDIVLIESIERTNLDNSINLTVKATIDPKSIKEIEEQIEKLKTMLANIKIILKL